MDRFGIIQKKSLKQHKNRAAYWSKKVISAGWMEDCGSFYRMKSYPEVWTMMGVKKVWKRHLRMGYAYAVIEGSTPKELLVTIQKYIIERVKRQITYRLTMASRQKASIVRRTAKPVYRCKSVARQLGYKSDMSGCIYRKKYMKVIKPSYSGLMVYLDFNGVLKCHYPPHSISLD